MRRTIRAVAAGLLLAGSSGIVAATPVHAQTSICDKYGSAPVQGGRYIVQNNVWGADTQQCIDVTDSGFTVSSSEHNNSTSGAPAAYPSIFYGCHWGNCTQNSGLPMPLSAPEFGQLRSSVSMSFPQDGTWNASYDLWFDPTPRTDGQNTGAEMMIWLDYQGEIEPIGSPAGTANLAGATWEVWFGNSPGWNVVSYVHTGGTTSLNFSVNEFTQDAIQRGYIDPSWYLTSIQAGFEPWIGGTGLSVNSFSVDTQSLQQALPTPSVAGEVATDLDVPWSVAYLPDGGALVTERQTAEIKLVEADGSVRTLGTVPGVVPGGEGGLLGIAVSPDFATDNYVYAYITAADDNRIVRMTFDGESLGEPEVIFDGIAKNVFHNGGRLKFGPDGMLYATTGDAGTTSLAQDPNSPNGKILRLTPDGEPAPGNPIEGNPMWSMGHRNVQGIAWDDEGRLWASEFGQDTWDELNLIEPGENYGWPVVEGQGDDPQYVDPLAQWPTSQASPSGITIAEDTVWMAALGGRRLWGVPIADGGLNGEPQAFFVNEYGRLRAVESAPDGSLWLVTNNTDGRGRPTQGDDRILRLTLN